MMNYLHYLDLCSEALVSFGNSKQKEIVMVNKEKKSFISNKNVVLLRLVYKKLVSLL